VPAFHGRYPYTLDLEDRPSEYSLHASVCFNVFLYLSNWLRYLTNVVRSYLCTCWLITYTCNPPISLSLLAAIAKGLIRTPDRTASESRQFAHAQYMNAACNPIRHHMIWSGARTSHSFELRLWEYAHTQWLVSESSLCPSSSASLLCSVDRWGFSFVSTKPSLAKAREWKARLIPDSLSSSRRTSRRERSSKVNSLCNFGS